MSNGRSGRDGREVWGGDVECEGDCAEHKGAGEHGEQCEELEVAEKDTEHDREQYDSDDDVFIHLDAMSV